MGLESGNFIGDLVATNPTGTDQRHTTDDHIRLIKNVLKTTFPNLAAAVPRTATELSSVKPTIETRTSTFTLAASDFGKIFKLEPSTGGMKIHLPAAAGLGSGFHVTFMRSTPNLVPQIELDTTGSESINGSSGAGGYTICGSQWERVTLTCDGTGFFTGKFQAAQSDTITLNPSDPGYAQFVGSLILQWGNANSVSPNVDTNISLPLTFPAGAIIGFASYENVNSSGQTVSIAGLTVNTVKIRHNGSGQANVNWLVIGY